MQKGINLTIKEAKENIARVLNESSLPISIIEMALREILIEVSNLNTQTIEKEKKEYEDAIKAESAIRE